MKLLERNYERLDDEIWKLGQELKKNAERHSRALKAESEERKKSDKGIEAQVQRAVVEGLNLELACILYFALGIVVAATSSEIAISLGATPCP